MTTQRIALTSIAAGLLIATGIVATRSGSPVVHHDAVVPFDQRGHTSDLLTAEVQAGSNVTTGVILPTGWSLVGDPVPTSNFAIDEFHIEPRSDGATWLSVTAHNLSGSAERFSAVFAYSIDGGAP